MTLTMLSDGRLVRLTVCPLCGALVIDAELHRRWHEGAR